MNKIKIIIFKTLLKEKTKNVSPINLIRFHNILYKLNLNQ